MPVRTLLLFLRDERGATAIEYALLGTLIGIALIASFTLVGDGVKNLFNPEGAAVVTLEKSNETLTRM